MFNWSRQQAETLYYNSCFLIYSLVVVYIADVQGSCSEMFVPGNVCVYRVVFERTINKMRLLA